MTNQEKAKGILDLVDLVSGKYIGGAMLLETLKV